MIKLYGIANCDTVKKAKSFLTQTGLEFEFVDFKKIKPTTSELKLWAKSFGGWPVNKAGRTYKQLKEEYERADDQGKIALLQRETSLIKRPILVRDESVLLFGFKAESYEEVLK